MAFVRKHLSYFLFGLVVLLVIGLAVSHSRHTAYLVHSLAFGTPAQQKAAAAELIANEQFTDSITGEPTSTRVRAAAALVSLGNGDAVKEALGLLKDDDRAVRDQAVSTLEAIGAASPDNLKQLIGGLSDGDINVRKGTIEALTDQQHGIGPRTNPDVVQAILSAILSTADARGPGGDVLSSPLFEQRGANARAVPALLAMLINSDDAVKQGAADALGKIGDPAATPRLVQLMDAPSTSPAVRRVVIGAVALIASPDGEAALTEAIRNPNDDPNARAQAATGLGKIGSPSAIRTLIATLTDEDLDVRAAAVAALGFAARQAGQPPKPAVVAQLSAALSDRNPLVTLGIARALRDVHDPAADAALVRVLQTDTTDRQAQVAAATALGFESNAAAVQPLVTALSSPSGRVQVAAEEALGRMGQNATAALIALTDHGGADAYYAATALGTQAATHPELLPDLEKAALSATSPIEQRWIAVALGNTNQPQVSGTLKRLEQSANADVAYVAREQLDHLARTD